MAERRGARQRHHMVRSQGFEQWLDIDFASDRNKASNDGAWWDDAGGKQVRGQMGASRRIASGTDVQRSSARLALGRRKRCGVSDVALIATCYDDNRAIVTAPSIAAPKAAIASRSGMIARSLGIPDICDLGRKVGAEPPKPLVLSSSRACLCRWAPGTVTRITAAPVP